MLPKKAASIIAIGLCGMLLAISYIRLTAQSGTAFEMGEPVTETDDREIASGGLSFAGYWQDPNSGGEGMYLAKHQDFLEIQYYPLNSSQGENPTVYKSALPVAAYQTYAADGCLLILEMNIGRDGQMSFDLIRIGYGGRYDGTEKLFSDQCDRLPYVYVTKLNDGVSFATNPGSESGPAQLSQRILLNYDSNGVSRLILLSKYPGPGNSNIFVGAGEYEYFENGDIAAGIYTFKPFTARGATHTPKFQILNRQGYLFCTAITFKMRLLKKYA